MPKRILSYIYGNIHLIAVWAVLFVLLVLLFQGAAETKRVFPAFSLRYDDGIEGKAALAARQYSINGVEDEEFWPTFWREDDMVKAESETAGATCISISYSGEGSLAWNAEFLRGAMPGVADEAGCALSGELAQSLFGSMDVVGMTVYLDENEYIVRGVFEGSQAVALLSKGDEKTDLRWQAADLSGGPKDTSKTTASNFGVSSGLGRPSAVLDGSVFSAWSMLACFAPIIILVVYALIRLLLQIRRPFRGVAVFAACLGIALFLPAILALLPGSLVPDMWSDFSFWSSLGKQFDNSLREFFGMIPHLRDVEGKLLLLRQGVLCSAGVLCAAILCIIQNRKPFVRDQNSEVRYN